MQASLDAGTVARDLARTPVGKLESRTAALAAQAGLARVTVQVGATRVVDIGDRTAIWRWRMSNRHFDMQGQATRHAHARRSGIDPDHGRRRLCGIFSGQQERPHRGRRNALYTAKHAGKNRTVKAEPETANVFGGE
jgi:hypothetical protein